jgi:hypothetical protein
MDWETSSTRTSIVAASRHVDSFGLTPEKHIMRNTNSKNVTTERKSESKTNARVEVTHDDIRCRAHEIFCDRNGSGGDHVADWLRAEQELTGASQRAPIADRSSALDEASDRPKNKLQLAASR